jgi:N12 class adenine-specific DNA methylase
MVAAAMESKRLGLCNKPLIVVPNHIIEQFASEFLQLYPSVQIFLYQLKKILKLKIERSFAVE